MDNNSYIVHGTLNDYIDYARLIECQAGLFLKSEPAKVINIKSSKAKRENQSRKNRSVNTNRCNTLTNQRKILSKKVPRTKSTN